MRGSDSTFRSLKATIVVAWIMSTVALTMVGNLTDRYRHGYEDMFRDASLLFYAAAVLGALAAIAAFLVRRRDAQSVGKGWFVASCIHVACSAIILGLLLATLWLG